MLTLDQTATYTAAALAYIAANPLAGQQPLRAYLAERIGGDNAWGDATEIILQEIVYHAGLKAFAAADQAEKDAVEARIQAEWQARMDAPVPAAPVYETTVTPTAPKTLQDHVEAIKAAYAGPDGNAFDLHAACRYALLNDVSPDTVANAASRPVGECQGLMFPG